MQKLESGISLLINGKIQNRNHLLSRKGGSEKHDTLHDLLRCPLIPVFWVGLCVPWQRSWLSHVAAAAQPTRLNSQRLVPLHVLLLNMRANKAQRISWPYKQKRDEATPETLVPGGYKPPNTNLQLISTIRIRRRGHDLPRNSANSAVEVTPCK